jgi:hypothetical protein
MIGLLLIGFWQPISGFSKGNEPGIAALWDSYLANDAWKSPTVRFPYQHCFKSAAQKYDLPLSLLLAVARGESNFNPRAKSNRNCYGVMQIQWPKTAHHLGIYRLAALYEPCTNISAGARYLRELLDRYDGNLHLALAAYNYGPRRIRKNFSPGHIPEGARWYSGYIYHHLKHILQKKTFPTAVSAPDGGPVYIQGKRLEIIAFDKPYRASSFYQYLRERAPALKLDWYRIGLGRYQVVMLYTNKRTLENGKKILKKLGINVKSR